MLASEALYNRLSEKKTIDVKVVATFSDYELIISKNFTLLSSLSRVTDERAVSSIQPWPRLTVTLYEEKLPGPGWWRQAGPARTSRM